MELKLRHITLDPLNCFSCLIGRIKIMLSFRSSLTLCGVLAVALARPASAGLVVPFTEGFDADAANWFDPAGAALLDWNADGGPSGAGDGHVTTDFAFSNAGPFGTTLFRAQDEFGSSGGAFEGNWMASGVDTLSFWFKHDVPVPINVFARLAGPANFPGAAAVSFVPVAPNTWTEVAIPVFEGAPNIMLEGTSYADVFSNIGHIQIGISTPEGFENDTTMYSYALDNVSITPAPGALGLLALAGLAGRRRRRS